MKYLFLTLIAVFSLSIQAQEMASIDNSSIIKETSESEMTAEETDDEEESSLEISGFVDAYYQYSFQESPFPTSFTETHNSFSLGMANLVFAKSGDKVGFVADLAVGPRAEVANGFTGTTLAAIKQLFITYSPSERITFTLGNFGTHVGYEVIDAPANVNYSTSYMFSNGPFYHTGLKMDVDLGSGFGAMVGILDDTDSKFDFVPGKHFGAQLSYANDDAGIYLNYLGGVNEVDEEDEALSTGHQVDLTATYQVTEAFGLGINATSRSNVNEGSDNTGWFGTALYANYAFSDAFTLGLRGEYIGDNDGEILGAIDGSVFAFTISGNIKVGPVTFIPEFRLDSASDDVFLALDDELLSSTSALTFAAIYAF